METPHPRSTADLAGLSPIDISPPQSDPHQSPATERLLKHAPVKLLGEGAEGGSPTRDLHSPATTATAVVMIGSDGAEAEAAEDLDCDPMATDGPAEESPDCPQRRPSEDGGAAEWSEEDEEGREGVEARRKRRRTLSEGSEVAGRDAPTQTEPEPEPAAGPSSGAAGPSSGAAGPSGEVASTAAGTAPQAPAPAPSEAPTPLAPPAAAASGRGGRAARSGRPARGGRGGWTGVVVSASAQREKAYEREKRALRVEVVEHKEIKEIGPRYLHSGFRIATLPKAHLLDLARDLRIDLAKYPVFASTPGTRAVRARSRSEVEGDEAEAAGEGHRRPSRHSHGTRAAAAAATGPADGPSGAGAAAEGGEGAPAASSRAQRARVPPSPGMGRPRGLEGATPSEKRRLRDEIIGHPRFRAERKQLLRGHARLSQLSREECAELARALGIDLGAYPSLAPPRGAPDGPVPVDPKSPWAREDAALPEFGRGYAVIFEPTAAAGSPSAGFPAAYEGARRRLVEQLRAHPRFDAKAVPEAEWPWVPRARLLRLALDLGLEPAAFAPFFAPADIDTAAPPPRTADRAAPTAEAAPPPCT